MSTQITPHTVSGKMTVRIVRGFNGNFPVGVLETEMGEFVIKDKLIEQMSEGRYEGEFGVGKIYMADYNVPGKKIVEQRMSLTAMNLKNGEEYSPPSDEPDPMLEDEKPPAEPDTARARGQSQTRRQSSEGGGKPAAAEAEASGNEESPAPSATESATDGGRKRQPEGEAGASAPAAGGELDGAGFSGEQIAHIGLGESVKLDNTLDRAVLRKQKTALQSAGYKFDYQSQEWLKT